jgi:nitrite reductase/ring-hydroxylating ferredoxin subunit
VSPGSFVPLEQVQNLKTFQIEGRDLLLVQQAGVPAILEGICPHAGHPFGDSRIVGSNLRCDMHGYLFDVHSGACTYHTEGPCRGLRVYLHELKDGFIGVVL